jgi:hypothetical protein
VSNVPLMRAAAGTAPGRARWATVRVETDTATYVGRVYVPETRKRFSDMLCDDRPFLNLTEVSVDDGEQIEAYVAVNKRYVRTVRVLDEGAPEPVATLSRMVGEPYPRR